ncbi:MAG TPA: carboxypeptidase regulatory-like domain-containing protein, partial [Bryobacteraceae bacterium]|nr:carboxypeptidase regulatory-like domain-containing protein [Bryobacteraceae bacterium]
MASAQTTTGTLIGMVRDKSGAGVPDVQVIAQHVDTALSRTVVTDETGAYLIPNLPVGEYMLIAEKAGFSKLVQKGITLVVDQNARVDVSLSVGNLAESITVTAESTGVETRATAMGELVDRTRIQELPLNGRNAMSLARVVPGVISVSAPTIQTQSRSGPSITVAGGRNTQNEFRFDGISFKNLTQNTALNYPSPDALQEFRILTSNYSAEFGRNTGGVFNSLTRSGTNQFHGTVWEFLRNTELNARNFFSVAKPDLKQNQYGFTFGGPAIHNKLFFFGSYQGARIRQSQLLATARPPTAAERQGDFSASPKTPVDPDSKLPFPGGRIPAARFDAVAMKVMEKYMPAANTADGRWVKLASQPSDDDQYLWRVDYQATEKNSFNLRFFRDSSGLSFQSGNVTPYARNSQGITVDNWAAQDTHTFGPGLLNELRLGVNRLNSFVKVLDSTQLSDLGAVFPGVITPQMPNISVSGYYSLATTDIFQEHPNIYQIGNTLRWFKGKHSVSLGGEWERTEMFNRGSSGNQGTFAFDGSVTGVAFADFLIGKPLRLTQASPYERLVKGWDWYGFLQDDIRLTPRLTVNAGLRYQWFQPYHAVYGRTNTYRTGQQSVVAPGAPKGMVFPGDAGVPAGLVPTDK